ncbi:MAG: hypothetical protein ACYS26_11070, partial [Planctomycetota bacterium]
MTRPASSHCTASRRRPVQVWAILHVGWLGLLVGWLGLLAGLASPAAAEIPVATNATGVDPKDGPDIDLRFELREDRVRVLATPNLAFVD